VRQAAADGSTIADRHVTNLLQRGRQERCVLDDERRLLGGSMSRDRPDSQASVEADAAKAFDPIYVDQVINPSQA
jgi:hypothetical protein